jgi:hypothetical protein
MSWWEVKRKELEEDKLIGTMTRFLKHLMQVVRSQFLKIS